MTAAELWHREPVVVEVVYRDGRRADVAFGSRLEAEAWVTLIPLLQTAGVEDVVNIHEVQLRRAAVGLN